MREKDNPSALSWDEIAKANYTTWVTTYSSNAIAAAANMEIDNSPVFKQIKQDIEWIHDENDKQYPLDFTKYKEEQKELKNTYHQLDSLLKPAKELSVTNVAVDIPIYTADKEKAEKNKQFLDRLKDDLYVDETVKVLSRMINQGNMAKKN